MQVRRSGSLPDLLRGRVDRSRLASTAAVAVIHGLIFYLLVTSFAPRAVSRIAGELKLFRITSMAPPPPARPAPPALKRARKARAPHSEGAASPRNLDDRPAAIVAPPPKLLVPPPLLAAPVAAEGRRVVAGASTIAGPGTGSGGEGLGSGSGAVGNGTGGGGGGAAVPARWIKGRIKDSDYPSSAWQAHAGGTVLIRFGVGVDGRVTDCRVTRSSGHADLDATTCTLILRRFRYRPARDTAGRPVPDVVTGEQVWETAADQEQETGSGTGVEP